MADNLEILTRYVGSQGSVNGWLMKLAVNNINPLFFYNSGKLKYYRGPKAPQFLFGNIQANNVVSPCLKLSMLIIISPKITDNLKKTVSIQSRN
jgi:hypothetical protein